MTAKKMRKKSLEPPKRQHKAFVVVHDLLTASRCKSVGKIIEWRGLKFHITIEEIQSK
jgi:hypothetical protein